MAATAGWAARGAMYSSVWRFCSATLSADTWAAARRLVATRCRSAWKLAIVVLATRPTRAATERPNDSER